MALSMATRKQVTKEMAQRYMRARKRERACMLDELCALTGYNRSYAARLLRLRARAPARPAGARRRDRGRIYGPETREPLRKCWAVAGGICGKRLAPFLPELVAALERHQEIELSGEQREKLLAVSAATIDRLLAGERRRASLRGTSGTKPGGLLRSQIPVRTFAEWDHTQVGFVEVDLVGHDGGSSRGDYCQSLDLTDVASAWTEVRAAANKAQRCCFEALQLIEHQISFTRSRPYRKNDNWYVEEKNSTVVRRTVGWARYDTEAELATLNRLYEVRRLYVNYFQPQVKLIAKERSGARVRKHYDAPTTPYRWLLALGALTPPLARRLEEEYLALNPAVLRRQITHLQRRVVELSSLKEATRRKEVQASAPS